MPRHWQGGCAASKVGPPWGGTAAGTPGAGAPPNPLGVLPTAVTLSLLADGVHILLSGGTNLADTAAALEELRGTPVVQLVVRRHCDAPLDAVAGLTALTHLELDGACLAGCLVDGLRPLTRLQHLGLGDCGVRGDHPLFMPTLFANEPARPVLPHLTSLDLSSNPIGRNIDGDNISDRCMPQLTRLAPALERLALRNGSLIAVPTVLQVRSRGCAPGLHLRAWCPG